MNLWTTGKHTEEVLLRGVLDAGDEFREWMYHETMSAAFVINGFQFKIYDWNAKVIQIRDPPNSLRQNNAPMQIFFEKFGGSE